MTAVSFYSESCLFASIEVSSFNSGACASIFGEDVDIALSIFVAPSLDYTRQTQTSTSTAWSLLFFYGEVAVCVMVVAKPTIGAKC